MKHLFICLLDIPIKKRMKYNNLDIFWNSIARNKSAQYISRFLKKQKKIKRSAYANILKSTKIYINTLSPVGLISPRFFECMSTNALVFCEESSLYDNIFSKEVYVSFKSDLSDFDEKLNHYLSNDNERNKIVEKARAEVNSKHTWKKRITELLLFVDDLC